MILFLDISLGRITFQLECRRDFCNSLFHLFFDKFGDQLGTVRASVRADLWGCPKFLPFSRSLSGNMGNKKLVAAHCLQNLSYHAQTRLMSYHGVIRKLIMLWSAVFSPGVSQYGAVDMVACCQILVHARMLNVAPATLYWLIKGSILSNNITAVLLHLLYTQIPHTI